MTYPKLQKSKAPAFRTRRTVCLAGSGESGDPTPLSPQLAELEFLGLVGLVGLIMSCETAELDADELARVR